MGQCCMAKIAVTVWLNDEVSSGIGAWGGGEEFTPV